MLHMFNYMYSLGFKLPKTTFYQNHPRITHVFYSTHALFMIISCDHPSRCTDTPNRKLLQYITVFCFTSNSFCNKTINSIFLLFCKVVRIVIFSGDIYGSHQSLPIFKVLFEILQKRFRVIFGVIASLG